MRRTVFAVLALSFAICWPCTALAQSSGDEAAVNQVIDRVFELEVAKDMTAQAELMADDRIRILPQIGRMTDHAMDMQMQQAVMDLEDDIVPGIQWFYEVRDRIIRFYGDGDVAVASFYIYSTFVLPAGAPTDLPGYATQSQPFVLTWVMEKQQGDWKIVHTHGSSLNPPVVQ